MPRCPTPTSRTHTTILEELNDGYFRVRTPQGRVAVLELIRCVECEAFIRPNRSKLCLYCANDERDRIRIASIDVSSRKQRIANLELAQRKRAAKMSLASPKWRDREKIKAIYEEARRLTAETGIVHHVDHYYPLQGMLCSGLHVHENLRILSASENCSKSNGLPLEHSPATRAFLKEYGESGLRIWVKWAKGERVKSFPIGRRVASTPHSPERRITVRCV